MGIKEHPYKGIKEHPYKGIEEDPYKGVNNTPCMGSESPMDVGRAAVFPFPEHEPDRFHQQRIIFL